jgi:hypothetical protein
VLLALALWLPRLQGPIDLRFDASVYYILGTSLAEGHGYRLLNEPGEIEAVQYPPLLPVVVAAHQELLGTSDPARVGRALRFWNLVLFAAYLPAVYALARRWLVPWQAVAVAVLTATNVWTLYLSDALFAELPFALTAVLFVLCRDGGQPGRTLLAALLGAAAYLFRSLGLALLAAWVGESLLRGQWRRAAARAALALVPVLLWQTYLARVTSGAEFHRVAYPYQRADYQFYNVPYQQNLALVDSFKPELGRMTPGAAVRRFAKNAAALPSSLGQAVSAEPRIWELFVRKAAGPVGLREASPALAAAVVLLLGGLALGGLALLAARREWFVPLFAAGTAALICLTPWPDQFARYLMPLTPFLLVALALALQRISRLGRPAAVLSVLIVLGIAAGQAFALVKLFTSWHQTVAHPGAAPFRLFFYDEGWRSFDATVDRLAAEPAGVAASTVPHWLYLRTGRKAVFYPLEPHPAATQRLLDAVPVRYLVLDELEVLDVSARYAAPVPRAYPELWQPRGSGIYRRTGAAPHAAAALPAGPRSAGASPPPAPARPPGGPRPAPPASSPR